jgi:hypothetical protein
VNGDDELLISTMAAWSKARVVGDCLKVSICALDEKWPPGDSGARKRRSPMVSGGA